MTLSTEKLRDHLENEHPIVVLGIFINRSGIRIQYREHFGDEEVDRKLRKAQLNETVSSFMKKAAYMDANLNRDSKMMLQLESSNVEILIQRVVSARNAQPLAEYRIRQDIVRNSDDQYIFVTRFYSLDCKDAAAVTAQTLREHVCSDDKKKYILELQHLGPSEEYTLIARFHTGDSYSTIMNPETQG